MQIFISYRRGDSAGHSGRLHDALTSRFGPGSVFMDVETINIGADFEAAIDEAIESSDAALVVIGTTWLDVETGGGRRLDDPRDYVRLEVAAALARSIKVIPVLVGGASMPSRDQLPDDIAGIVTRNAIELSDSRWREDIERLLDAIEGRERLSAAAGPRTNLPASRTSFIGRETELSEIARLLGSHRLVTLTGSGGSGKTRLAIEAARRELPEFGDGVWFIDLSALTDGQLVLDSIAASLGIDVAPGTSLLETLLEHCERCRLMFVLDNCEHLIAACADAADAMIARSEGTTILATSREPLGVAGEGVYRVPTLEVPSDDDATAETIGGNAAVALFTARARSVDGGFALTDANAPAVGEICRALDGIPLAIELAAARVSALSPDQICERLGDRFRLLSKGPRTALPRQQTLWAAVQWSYDLLTEPERLMLARLSEFAGGFTLEAAEHVCVDEDIDGATVAELMDELVEKSLLGVDRTATPFRFKMLETVREFASRQLEDQVSASAVRRRHAAWFSSVLESAKGRLHGPDGPMVMDQLRQDVDNFRHALNGLRSEDAEAELRFALGFIKYALHCDTLAETAEGERYLTAALAREQSSTELRARALFDLGQCFWARGDLVQAEASLVEAQGLAEAMGDAKAVTDCLWIRGDILSQRDDPDSVIGARSLLTRAEEIARSNSYENALAVVLNALGNLAHAQRDLDEARRCYEESLELGRKLGNRGIVSTVSGNVAGVYLELDDEEGARIAWTESLDVAREINYYDPIARALVGLGRLAIRDSDRPAADPLLLEALDVRRRCDEPAVLREIDWLIAALEEAFEAPADIHRTP